MKVLVTGSEGFVGRNLIPWLEREGIHVLRGVRTMRQPSSPNQIELGDLPRLDHAVAEKLHDYSAIIHLAGFAHQPQDSVQARERCLEVNVQGTKRVVEVATRAGIKKVIFLSSVKAHGQFPKGISVSEQGRDAPTDCYGSSKLQAEELGFEAAAKHGFQFLAIRPPLIYGPGVKANFLNLIKLAHSGIPLPFKNVKNQRSLCYVDNLSMALTRLVMNTGSESRKFYFADSRPLSTREIIEALAKQLNCKSRMFPMPSIVLESITKWPILGPMADKLLGDLAVNSEAIEQYLSWKSPKSTDSGFAATVQWYLASLTTDISRPKLSVSKRN